MPISYVDDPSIGDDDQLWRRIPPWWIIFDGNLNHWRPSSAAFEDDADGNPMSIYVARFVKAAHESEVLGAGGACWIRIGRLQCCLGPGQ